MILQSTLSYHVIVKKIQYGHQMSSWAIFKTKRKTETWIATYIPYSVVFVSSQLLPTIDRVTAILVLRLVGDLVTLTFQLWSWKVLILEILSKYAYLSNLITILFLLHEILAIKHRWVIPSRLSIALQALLKENITPKLLLLSWDLFFKIFAFPGCSPYILFYQNLFSLLPSGWFVIAVCCPISVRKLVK